MGSHDEVEITAGMQKYIDQSKEYLKARNTYINNVVKK